VKDGLVYALCGILLALAYPIANAARPTIEQGPVGLSQKQNEALEEKAQASLFGQFRGSLSDFLYLQVDKFVHEGVEIRGKTETELKKDRESVTSSDGLETGARQHNGTETTVVPGKKDDWRGVLGDIERQVTAYKPMGGHGHRDPKDAVQLYRLMTASNPKFIRGWTEGAWLMARKKEVGPEKALAFLRAGEKANPESIEIASSLGWLLTRDLKRYDEGRVPLERAIALGKTLDPEALSAEEKEAQEEALVSAYRFLIHNRRYAGDIPAARAWALDGQVRFPDDPTCRRFLEEYPAETTK
jgi:hypothetical protein